MLEQGISDLLLADAGVIALIGDRLYPVVPPPELQCYPALTMQSMPSAAPDYTLHGEQINYSRLQFTAWARNYADCRHVLAAVDLVLNKLSRTLGDGTRVLFASSNSPIDHFDDVPRLFRSSADYEFEFV